MEIQPLNSLFPVPATEASNSAAANTTQEGINSFKDMLDQALQGVDALQKNAQQLAGQVATGDASSFHDAVIASEKALLAFQLTTTVQSKVVAAYNQIMAMQI
jgi:flagellar hook-basal body complex protein FliE